MICRNVRRPIAVAAALGILLSTGAPATAFGQLAGSTDGLADASPDVDHRLQEKLEKLVKGFPGEVGLYVRHLVTGESASIRSEDHFPTSSMIKVPILLKIFDLIEQGKLDYHQELTYADSLLFEGESDLLGSFRHGERIDLSKVVLLMITTSDNTASLWLQQLAGTGTAINEWLAEHGFECTRVNSRTWGRQEEWKKYGWGQTSPREMAELLVMIRDGEAVSPAASEEMYRALTRIYWNDESLSQIPPTVQAASKQGASSDSRSEVVLVNAPHGDYVFSVITGDQEDTSWGQDNAGFALLRKVSKLLWNHFEPESDWVPSQKY
ncbi:MAG: serine hydrolase [Gemmatimonadota bacterium]